MRFKGFARHTHGHGRACIIATSYLLSTFTIFKFLLEKIGNCNTDFRSTEKIDKYELINVVISNSLIIVVCVQERECDVNFRSGF